MYIRIIGIFCLSAALFTADHVIGDVIEYDEWDEWQTAVGEFTTIDFTGFPQGTIITDQYADLGIMFTDGNDRIYYNDGFLNDGVGLDGQLDDQISMAFDMSLYYIAVDYPGYIQFELYHEGELMYTNIFGGGSVGLFAGLLSTEPFDSAVLLGIGGSSAVIDDLHFGPPIPAPPALALLATAGVFHNRRRRRR